MPPKAKGEKTKTRAEIQLAYRERKKTQNKVQFLEKERQRWHKRREQGKVKLVSAMTHREHRIVKRRWKKASQCYRDWQAEAQRIQDESPPATPTTDTSADREDVFGNKKRGRKKMKRNQTKAYRMIVKLQAQVQNEKKLREKYRKRLHRWKKSMVPLTDASFSTSPITHGRKQSECSKIVLMLRLTSAKH